MKQLSNLPDKGFKTVVIKMPSRLERRMDELREDFNKEKICKRTNQR